MLYLGTQGKILAVDLRKLKIVHSVDTKVAVRQIQSIAASKVLVLTDNKFFEYDFLQSKITRSLYHFKTNTESKLPKFFAMKDKSVVEVREKMPTTIFLRDHASNAETHKFEGHSLPVERLVMLSD